MVADKIWNKSHLYDKKLFQLFKWVHLLKKDKKFNCNIEFV